MKPSPLIQLSRKLDGVIQFTAASKMMRELIGAGYKIERGAANVSSQLSGNVMTVRRGAPLSDFWHETGHALDMHGTKEGLKRATAYAEAQAAQKATGAAPNLAYRQQTRDLERRANRTAQQAMTDRGVKPEYVQQYRNEVAPHLNGYRKANSVAGPPGNPVNPPGNPGSPQPPTARPASNPPAPIKRSFGGATVAGAGVVAAGGLGMAAERKPKYGQGVTSFRSQLEAIQFGANPLFKAGIKSGTHKLGGVGTLKRIKLRDIHSPQHLVNDRKVAKLARFTKNMPGTPTVSHAGRGKYVLKDGNHRVNAAIRQGKRTIEARVQRMSARLDELVEFEEELQPHQKRLVERMMEPDRRGIVAAWGLGSGKTRGAIEAHKALGGKADVVLPAALEANYRKEMKRWGGSEEDTNIVSQQLVSRRGEAPAARTLIVDEGHRGRNPKSKLADAIQNSPAQKRIILTGTPIYNTPADIASVVNQAAGEKVLPTGAEFKNKFQNPTFWDRFRGRKVSNKPQLKAVLDKYVDYHPGDQSQLPRVKESTVAVPMGDRQSELYHAAMSKIPTMSRAKMQVSGLTGNIDRLKPYLTGPRMVSNSSKALDPDSNEKPKLDRMASDLQEHLKNPKGKALIYSNWVGHGTNPLREELERIKVPHGVFTGRESTKDRNRAVEDYNSGRNRALIVSSSGGEGLDLKGTRMVQIAEPHFNNAKIRQVIGRSARMGSHSHLPDDEREVDVRRYVARPKRRLLWGHKKGVEDMLVESSRKKDEVDDEIADLMRGR